MPRAKPTLVRLHELPPGKSADFFALLSERTKNATRDGKPYYTCRFRDKYRTVTAMIWQDGGHFEPCDNEWRVGQYYKVRGQYFEHERYGPQIEIEQIRALKDEDHQDGFDLAQFVEVSRRDSEAMFAELRTLAEAHIADVPLRSLVLKILERHAAALKKLPATTRNFYPFPGGLLEHILAVTQTCLLLIDRYAVYYTELKPPLNRDLVVAGAILHDMGRVLELGDDPIQVQPTIPGRMLGHLFLGRDLVRDTARELGDVNPELVLMLEHIIITHLNLPEWGSPRLPLVPECLIIHHADDLDAKLEMYVRCLSRDKAEGAFTERDPVLGRHLFKGRGV